MTHLACVSISFPVESDLHIILIFHFKSLSKDFIIFSFYIRKDLDVDAYLNLSSIVLRQFSNCESGNFSADS